MACLFTLVCVALMLAGLEVTALPAPQQAQIAFLAKSQSTRTVANGATLIFEEIVTNSGAGYNAQTNSFICPETGTYYFYGTILSGDKVNCWYDLVRDSDVIYMGFADGIGGHFAASTLAVVVDCTSGQQVSLRARRDSCRYTSADTEWGDSFWGGYNLF